MIKMRRCSVTIRKGVMMESRRCRRTKGHNGSHTPDLVGMRFGENKVLRFIGAPGSSRPTQWLVLISGQTKRVDGRSLINGANRGRRCPHGLRHTPEYTSAYNHWSFVQRSKHYKGMPYYTEWNPKKGGSVWKAAQWIISNLGRKPDAGWSLDIIKHNKGFVPGNLRWVPRGPSQRKNQVHRTIFDVSDKAFAVEAKRRGYKKVR